MGAQRPSLISIAVAVASIIATPLLASGQTLTGLVVDQTTSVLPGVRVELRENNVVRASTVTDEGGRFTLAMAGVNSTITAALDGFETVTVPANRAAAITLPLATATEHTVVTASVSDVSAPGVDRIGGTLDPKAMQTMPVARPKVLESLPMLPSVMRGPDGLLRIGGTRPSEAALLIDGFDVTDPVTGVTTIDLPLESVKALSVLRDPTAATFGGMLGAVAAIETTTGGDHFAWGMQSFVPHPRVSPHGFGRIQGFFPRVYASGPLGRAHYFVAQEYDFERIRVPGVTTRSGRLMTSEASATSFARVDLAASRRDTLTVEAILVPGRSGLAGLSPLRPASASPTTVAHDTLIGISDRHTVGTSTVITVRGALFTHDTGVQAMDGATRLTPTGWRGSWFASGARRADRRSLSMTIDRAIGRRQTVTAGGGYQLRVLRGDLAQRPFEVEGPDAEPLRRIVFAPVSSLYAADAVSHLLVRDVWQATRRLQIDAGLRIDRDATIGDHVSSPRLGARLVLGSSDATTVRAGLTRFAGQLPLHALSFGQFGGRLDETMDPESGSVVSSVHLTPAISALNLPRADSVAIGVDHHLRAGLDVQLDARRRIGSRLSTVRVHHTEGSLPLDSAGKSRYAEVQAVVRQTWSPRHQLFVSYVRATATGETNDFATVLRDLTAPDLDPAGRARTAADVPHRVLAWGSFGLPRTFVVAPAVEWHTGFPFSALDLHRHYVGVPNAERLPDFFSLDAVAYRTITLRHRRVNVGAQMFNLTRHFNPRNVIAVAGTPHYRRGLNSVGMVVTGYMMVNWE